MFGHAGGEGRLPSAHEDEEARRVEGDETMESRFLISPPFIAGEEEQPRLTRGEERTKESTQARGEHKQG